MKSTTTQRTPGPGMRASRTRFPGKTVIAAVFVLVSTSAPGCRWGSADGKDAAGSDVNAAPSLEELADATYAGICDEPVTLTDGRWEGTPYVEGGASRPRAGLVDDFVLTGDVNGDGREDAVVLLWETSGGSGTRTYLAAMGRAGGAVVNLGTDLVGDRVQVKHGSIFDGHITLDLIQAGPEDAACCPSQKTLAGWRLAGGRLARTESEITGTLSLEDLEGPGWVLTAIGRDTPVPDQPPVTINFQGDRVTGNGGCNGFFGTITERSPGRIEFSAMGTTMMACPEPVMEVERKFLRALAGGVSYGFEAGRLVIGSESGEDFLALFFENRPPEMPPGAG